MSTPGSITLSELKRYPAAHGQARRVAIQVLRERWLDLEPLGISQAAKVIAGQLEPPRDSHTVGRYIRPTWLALSRPGRPET